MLAFVYWHDATNSSHETTSNNATTTGCIVGIIFFGLFADIFGRRKMYAFDLIVLMVGTMGFVISSTGYIPLDQTNGEDVGSIDYDSFGSMNIQSRLLFWRFLSGIGVGGEDPSSAVIASEFVPTSKRPRMLAAVFAMQGFDIAAGAIVLQMVKRVGQTQHPHDPANPKVSARAVDQIWRWIVGLGLIPALFTVICGSRFPKVQDTRSTSLTTLSKPLRSQIDSRDPVLVQRSSISGTRQ